MNECISVETSQLRISYVWTASWCCLTVFPAVPEMGRFKSATESEILTRLADIQTKVGENRLNWSKLIEEEEASRVIYMEYVDKICQDIKQLETQKEQYAYEIFHLIKKKDDVRCQMTALEQKVQEMEMKSASSSIDHFKLVLCNPVLFSSDPCQVQTDCYTEKLQDLEQEHCTLSKKITILRNNFKDSLTAQKENTKSISLFYFESKYRISEEKDILQTQYDQYKKDKKKLKRKLAEIIFAQQVANWQGPCIPKLRDPIQNDWFYIYLWNSLKHTYYKLK